MDISNDQRIFTLGQALGRLEGQVEQIASALRNEHEERVAAMVEHQQRSDSLDRRVDTILQSLAEQISKLSSSIERDKSDITDLKERRNNTVDASRWILGIIITFVVLGASLYGSYRGTELATPTTSCPLTEDPPSLKP